MRRVLPLLALASGVACSADPGEVTGLLPEVGFAEDWIGQYRGSGEGTVDGRPATAFDTELDITFDAEADRLPGCPACVTVRLDDSFLLPNVPVTSRTELDLSYRDGVVLYRLRLVRSQLGLDPDLLAARLTIGNADAPVPIVDMEYLLRRP